LHKFIAPQRIDPIPQFNKPHKSNKNVRSF